LNYGRISILLRYYSRIFGGCKGKLFAPVPHEPEKGALSRTGETAPLSFIRKGSYSQPTPSRWPPGLPGWRRGLCTSPPPSPAGWLGRRWPVRR